MVVVRTCTGCGHTKDLEEFYGAGENHTPKSLCKDCDNTRARPRTSARMLRTRARNRAMARLTKLHPVEFATLVAEEQQLAEQEAELLELLAKQGNHAKPSAPVALRPGPKRAGQDITHRVDTATCRRCHTHHDRGHTCPNCGHTEKEQP